MRIANTVQDSIVDGPGLRYVVFVQGCSHNCPGCHNPETHDPAGGREVSVEELIAEMLQNPLCEGLTISGGEPFDQADECMKLARTAREAGKNVWVYTGYIWDTLLDGTGSAKRFLLHIDVLVDGPFVDLFKSYELPFRGSCNQWLIDVPESLRTGEVVLWEPKSRGDLDAFRVPES